uniref:LysM peptidoglycan-binding domain-containing protein n=1 Tax=Elioraea sp. TaxID=2185103 RepID=UPI003F724FD1
MTPVPGLRRCNLSVSAVLLAGLVLGGCVGRAPAPTVVAPAVTPPVVAVLPGDTVRAIARRNDVDWQELATANGLAAPYTIRPGQRLMLPLRLPPPVPVGAAVAQAPDPVATAPVTTLADGERAVVAEPLPPPGPTPASVPAPAASPVAGTLPLPPEPPGAFVLPASIGGVPIPPAWPDDAPVAETDLRAIAEAAPPPGA